MHLTAKMRKELQLYSSILFGRTSYWQKLQSSQTFAVPLENTIEGNCNYVKVGATVMKEEIALKRGLIKELSPDKQRITAHRKPTDLEMLGFLRRIYEGNVFNAVKKSFEPDDVNFFIAYSLMNKVFTFPFTLKKMQETPEYVQAMEDNLDKLPADKQEIVRSNIVTDEEILAKVETFDAELITNECALIVEDGEKADKYFADMMAKAEDIVRGRKTA